MEIGAVGVRMQMKSMEIRWVSDCAKTVSSSKLKSRRRKLPIYISTNPSDIDPLELRNLYSTCNHSCHRFPDLNHDGKVLEPVDLNKLRLALSHSSVLVSVFCNFQDLEPKEEALTLTGGFADILRKAFPPVSPSNSKLIGFGRAVSDFGLTASIYDVMVIPSLQRMGIGKMIVKKIIRILTNRDIYDIAALCSVSERLFFKACGFGDDVLGSTTMMYGRTVSTYNEGDEIFKRAGRKLLLLPPLRKGL